MRLFPGRAVALLFLGCLCGFVGGWPSAAYAQAPPPVSVAPEPPQVEGSSPQGVSYATGAFSYQHRDLSAGDQAGMGLTRSYSSGASSISHELPFGWSHNFDISITTHKLITELTLAANELRPYAPLEWPYQYTVIIGNRSIPFGGGTGKQNPGPCAHPVTGTVYLPGGGSALGQVCPTGGFIGLYKVGRLGGETLQFSGDEMTGHYTFTDANGTIIYFGSRTESPGAPMRALYQVNPDGTRYDFSYNGNGVLASVTNNRGYSIFFIQPAGQQTTQASIVQACLVNNSRAYVQTSQGCPPGSPSVTYSYGSTGTYVAQPLLASYLDSTGVGENYSYGAYDHLTCIKRPGEACRIQNSYGVCQRGTVQSYDPPGLHWMDPVISQVDGSGNTYGYSFGANPPCTVPTTAGGSYTISLPTSASRTYTFGTSLSLPSRISDELGRVTNITYTGAGTVTGMRTTDLVSSYATPGGLSTLLQYDSRGNIRQIQKKSSDGSLLTRTYSYSSDCPNPATCNKPLALVDESGSETDWTYTSFGSAASEMAPAPVSGAARPLKLYSYVQKSAYVMNPSSVLVSTGQPIWLIATETECQTAAGSSALACDASAPQKVTTYQYGADGAADTLLLRGMAVSDPATGTTLRTCYGYDAQANKVSETSPRAGLTVCP